MRPHRESNKQEQQQQLNKNNNKHERSKFVQQYYGFGCGTHRQAHMIE